MSLQAGHQEDIEGDIIITGQSIIFKISKLLPELDMPIPVFVHVDDEGKIVEVLDILEPISVIKLDDGFTYKISGSFIAKS